MANRVQFARMATLMSKWDLIDFLLTQWEM